MKRITSKILLLFLFLLIITTIAGCGSFSDEKREAEDLMNSYFECTNDLENISTSYAYNKLSSFKNSGYGELQNYKLKGWKVSHSTIYHDGQKTSSVSAELRYWVVYSNSITEEYYLLGKRDSDERFLIKDARIYKKIIVSALYNCINGIINCFK